MERTRFNHTKIYNLGMAKETVNKIKFSDWRVIFASLGYRYVRNMKEGNTKTDKILGHERRDPNG